MWHRTHICTHEALLLQLTFAYGWCNPLTTLLSRCLSRRPAQFRASTPTATTKQSESQLSTPPNCDACAVTQLQIKEARERYEVVAVGLESKNNYILDLEASLRDCETQLREHALYRESDKGSGLRGEPTQSDRNTTGCRNEGTEEQFADTRRCRCRVTASLQVSTNVRTMREYDRASLSTWKWVNSRTNWRAKGQTLSTWKDSTQSYQGN
jgi:hypothetical protein